MIGSGGGSDPITAGFTQSAHDRHTSKHRNRLNMRLSARRPPGPRGRGVRPLRGRRRAIGTVSTHLVAGR